MSNLSIVVLAPTLDPKSAGIVVRHRLYNALMQIDQETQLLLYKGISNQFIVETASNEWIAPEQLGELFPDCIFIVPEVLCAKRLVGLRVARYYLNRLGAIAPAVADTAKEFAIAWNPEFCSEPFFYLFDYVGKVPLPASFESTQTKSRPINITYFGKNATNYKENFPLPTSILVTRSWPETTDHYLELMSMANYLFTFDCVSSTNVDALALGVKVVILDFYPHSEDIFRNKLSVNQPYLKAENYENEQAVKQYAEKCNKWLSNLREDQSNFEPNIKILYASIKRFFNESL